MSHSIRSAGWNQIGAPVASRRSAAAVMWSLCPWVSTIAVTRRPPIASTIGSARCGASMTSTSSSSPTSQTLLSTSKSCPSRLKTPLTTAFSMRALIARLRARSAPHTFLAAMLARPSSSPRSLEDDHAAQHVAVVNLLERGLGVVQPDRLGDERVEVEAALHVQVDKHREVPGGQAVAVPGGLDRAAAAEDLDQRQLDLHVRRRDADQDDPAGQVAGVESLLEPGRVAARVYPHVYPDPAGQPLDRLVGLGVLRVDRVGGAHLPGPQHLPAVDVDGDDRRRAGELRPGDRGVTAAAAAEDRDALAALDRAGV